MRYILFYFNLKNVLNQTQPMQNGRRKRDVDDFGDYEEELQFGFNDWEDVENEMKSVTPHLLPMLVCCLDYRMYLIVLILN